MNLIHIDDVKGPELALYASTSEAGLLYRFGPAEGVFIAESPKVIERALADGYEPISFLLEEKDERMYWGPDGAGFALFVFVLYLMTQPALILVCIIVVVVIVIGVAKSKK